MTEEEFPRLTFDPDTGRVAELELTEAQYVTLVATARCPVVLASDAGGAGTRCNEPLLLPCEHWTAHSGHADERVLTGEWRCASDHGPEVYLASLAR
jgi:hypothetical protein